MQEGGLKEPYLEGFKEAKIAGTNLMVVKNESIECKERLLKN